MAANGFERNSFAEPTFLSATDIALVKGLSVYKLKDFRCWIGEMIEQRIHRKKYAKYGVTNRGFTEEELQKFFNYFSDTEEKEKMAFQLQAYLGLRIGEAVKVKLSDIDLNKRTIRIDTEKANTCDSLYLHDKIHIALTDYINKHKEKIVQHNSFLLFSEAKNFHKQNLCSGYLRKKFREICRRSCLDESYGYASEYLANRIYPSGRKLHRLTTHSLRHYFITAVYNQTKDIITAKKLARHTDLKSTQVYIYCEPEKLQEGLEKTFQKTNSERDILNIVSNK